MSRTQSLFSHGVRFALSGLLGVSALISTAAWAQSEPSGEAFDVLGSIMDKSQKQLNAKNVIKKNNKDAEEFREKIIGGWWEFMQAKSNANPGEYCAAMFLRAQREPHQSGVDLFKEGMTVSLLGPGGSYRGALLAFSPLMKDHQFPQLQSGQKILVTLQQSNEAPQTLNAVYMRIGKSETPMIAFAVPSMQALTASLEDKARFLVSYQGKTIANIEWHSGFSARDALNACAKGSK